MVLTCASWSDLQSLYLKVLVAIASFWCCHLSSTWVMDRVSLVRAKLGTSQHNEYAQVWAGSPLSENADAKKVSHVQVMFKNAVGHTTSLVNHLRRHRKSLNKLRKCVEKVTETTKLDRSVLIGGPSPIFTLLRNLSCKIIICLVFTSKWKTTICMSLVFWHLLFSLLLVQLTWAKMSVGFS